MENKRTAGVIYAAASYLWWGFTPVYWKFFSGIGSLEIIAHRIFWAFFVSLFMLGITGGFARFKKVLSDRSQMGWIILRTVLLGFNWYTYVWAISHGRVLEASLGYYLNPLVSIFLGLVFMKENLTGFQWAAVGFAAFGVILKTALVGSFPVVSVILAFSFGFYGLMKKKSADGSIVGMTIESFLLLPLAAFYLVFTEIAGTASFLSSGPGMKLMFFTTGIITVVPLVLFAKGTTRIPLTWIGFLQFIAPTMMLIFGIFIYHENMTVFDIFGFASVWIGIAIFLISSRKS